MFTHVACLQVGRRTVRDSTRQKVDEGEMERRLAEKVRAGAVRLLMPAPQPSAACFRSLYKLPTPWAVNPLSTALLPLTAMSCCSTSPSAPPLAAATTGR